MTSPSPSSCSTPAPALPLPPPPPPHTTDPGTHIQEHLDKLALACFNAVLEVSKVTGREIAATTTTSMMGSGAGSGGAGGGGKAAEEARTKASQMGLEIGKLIGELEEAIDTLPVIQTPPSTSDDAQSNNTLTATKRRLKELEAEYKRVHQELEETVANASKLSHKLRQTLASNK